MDAPAEHVWDRLVDPAAMYWLVTDCVLAFPVPRPPCGVGSIYCAWQRCSGIVRPLVQEVVEFEPNRLIVFMGRERPQDNYRLQFRLDPRGDRTAVEVTYTATRYRHEWGYLGRAMAKTYARRLAKALKSPPAHVVSEAQVEPLLLAPSVATAWEVLETEIQARPEEVWRFAEDKEGAYLGGPDLETQWAAEHQGSEISVALVRTAAGGLSCGFEQIVRHGPDEVTERSALTELRHEVSRADRRACVLKTSYRWHPKKVNAPLLAAALATWQGRVKAAAEGGPPGDDAASVQA